MDHSHNYQRQVAVDRHEQLRREAGAARLRREVRRNVRQRQRQRIGPAPGR